MEKEKVDTKRLKELLEESAHAFELTGRSFYGDVVTALSECSRLASRVEELENDNAKLNAALDDACFDHAAECEPFRDSITKWQGKEFEECCAEIKGHYLEDK